MRLEYYLFALFVFALAVILAVLIIYGLRKNKGKEDAERAKKEEKLMMMYFEVEDMIESLKEYVEQTREKINADIRRIETDMSALSTVKESLFVLRDAKQHESEEAKPETPKINENLKKPGEQAEKPTAAAEITREFTLEEAGNGACEVRDVARELDRSRSEIELMLKMQKFKNKVRN